MGDGTNRALSAGQSDEQVSVDLPIDMHTLRNRTQPSGYSKLVKQDNTI
jgi:hypothetical protein